MVNHKSKSLSIALYALIAVIVLGIGYATINSIPLIINGTATASPNQNNFKVEFNGYQDGPQNIVLDPEPISKGLSASFTTKDLTAIGDKAIIIFNITNSSTGLNAEIEISNDGTSNTNAEYFKVTRTFGTPDANNQNKTLLDAGATTTLAIEVEVVKTPIENNQESIITTRLVASPVN